MFGMERCKKSLKEDVLPSTPFSEFHYSLKTYNISYNTLGNLLKTYLKHQDLEDDETVILLDKYQNARNATTRFFKSIDKSPYLGKSFVLEYFNIPEYHFIYPFIGLFMFILVFRVVAYFVLLYKSSPKKK